MLIATMLWTDLYNRVSLEMVLQSSIYQLNSLSMSKTCIRGIVIQWATSYLDNRNQYICQRIYCQKYFYICLSVYKLFCMYINADCLSNKFSELKSVLDSCGIYTHLIGVCDIKPTWFCFTPISEFSMPCYFCSIPIMIPNIGEVYPFILELF